ncbi:hypothetical protein JCM14036_22430 [Desulfotomaculum defluvii]
MQFYTSYKTLIFASLLLVSIIVCGVHFIVIGGKGKLNKKSTRDVIRFNRKERLCHLFRSFSFVLVAISGFTFILNLNNITTAIIHGINGWIFVISSVLTMILWFRDCILYDYDKQWLRYMGNYLTKSHDTLPSGKFNAGQKILFWITSMLSIVLMITGILLINGQGKHYDWFESVLAIHGISAALTISFIIGHIYLSIFANPGTIRVLVDGKVSKEWASYHHPNWQVDQVEKH